MMAEPHEADRFDAPWRAALWIVLIVGASLGFSRAFACATPFVALATVAGTQMPARTAALTVALAWLANQAVGFGLLHYPHTWDTLAWGGAIGLAAMAAWATAAGLARAAMPSALRIGLAFLAGFVVYEGLLYAAAFVLPSEGDAYTLAIVSRIFLVNAVACLGLLALHAVAAGVEGVPARRIVTRDLPGQVAAAAAPSSQPAPAPGRR